MPDFDTRKPQGSNERSRPRMRLITNRLSSLLSASKFRILSIASALRRSLIANRYRSLFVGGVLLFVVVAAPVGLLIYSFGGFDHLQQMDIQQETRTIPGMQMSHMENIRIDENQKGKLVFQLSGPYQTPLNYAISNMNANGSSLEQLTDTVDKRRMGYTSEDPARSPDLKRIAFTRPASQYPASVDASASASASASAGSAGPSPILVPYVFVMNADGSEETRLVDMAAAKPDWSPDGQKIAFTRQGCPGAAPESETMNATTGIFTMDSDGTDPALVRFFVNEIASSPEWGVTAQQVGVTKQANEGQPAEEAIADWQALDARLPDLAVQAYIEQMNELLRGVNLHDRVVSFEETDAMYMISSALKGFGPSGKEEIVRFLARAGLLPSIPINYLDLRGIDLSGANLSGAQWSSDNLSGARLLSAKVAEDQLERAESLAGATMPDGSQHP